MLAETLWVLPGLWQVLVSLGVFASVRSLPRSVALGLCAAALLAVASCSQNGSYRLSWVFVDYTTKATVSTATGCGRC